MTQATSVLLRDPLRSGNPRIMVLVEADPFLPLLRFFRSEGGLSVSSERGYAYALVRFINWLAAHGAEFRGSERSQALAAFASDLRSGTIKTEEETGLLKDTTGLWWRPTSLQNAHLACKRITRFGDWLTETYGMIPLNPERSLATVADQIRYWAAWSKRKQSSMLGHLKEEKRDLKKASLVREIKLQGKPLRGMNEPKAFPLDLIEPLFMKGFIVRGKENSQSIHEKYNLRDMAITILCLYAGCRISEPLHLYVTDIPSGPEDPFTEPLLIYEPHDGIVFHQDERSGVRHRLLRADYLSTYCGGKKPLTLETGRRRAGWKGALLHDWPRRAFRLFWVDPKAADLFYAVWAAYLQQRPFVLGTPWAFLTRDGQPLGVGGFEETWAAAMRRIGVSPSKIDGTTPHGLRHRYGQFLNGLEMNSEEKKKIIQVCMHHSSVLSQEVYLKLGPNKVIDLMANIRGERKIPALDEITNARGPIL